MLNNEYSEEYYYLINFVKLQNRKKNKDEYFELHHIIPTSLGGLNTKENTVLLTPDEHFHCHVLLTHMTESKENIKMNYALLCLRRKIKSEYRDVNFDEYTEYANAKIIARENTSNRLKGKPRSAETIEKMKKNKSAEHCDNISKGLKGRIPWNKDKIGCSKETSEKISKSAKKMWETRIVSEETKIKMRIAAKNRKTKSI